MLFKHGFVVLINTHGFLKLINLFLLSNFFTEIRKSLTAISKLKGCEVVAEWIKPCERHLYWSATSTFSDCGRVIWAKFKSFLNHVVNKHSGFDEPLFNRCVHRDIPPRKWLKVGMGILVILNGYLLLQIAVF